MNKERLKHCPRDFSTFFIAVVDNAEMQLT